MTVAEIHELGLAEVDRIETEMRLIVEELGFDNLTLQQFTDMIRFRLFVNLLLRDAFKKKKTSYGGKSSLPVLPPPPPTKVGNKTLGNFLVVLDPLPPLQK